MSLISDELKKDNPVEKTRSSFEDFEMSDKLKVIIKNRGFHTPTQIQEDTIPEVLKGSDVVGISKTGSGKTGAFLIPLINKVLSNKNSKVLIVAPTRELATQIDEEFRQFSRGLHIYSAVCIGGVNITRQIEALYRNPQFVVGTPGRLLDLTSQRKINFNRFNYVVLDEVDRMLDMGFIHDIKSIISELPKNRQSLFFSATLDDRTKSVMKGFLKNPVIVSVESNMANVDISQEIINTRGRDKSMILQNILDQKNVEKTLVFVRTKRGADKLSRMLNSVGFNTAAMHGNRTQSQRQRSLNEFKSSQIRVLIATDVAARGLDVEDITHVINFDLPETQEDYIHRIGRTGRGGKKGVAISFIQ